MSFYAEICKKILSHEKASKQDIHRWKIQLCRTYKFSDIPSNSDIIANIPDSYSEELKKKLILLLQRKPMRTIAGVAIVAVMTSPKSCPHGKCLPCPGGPVFDSPQSYTGFEPAAMRAKMHDFDPFKQVQARIYQLHCIGHPTDKIDLIIMGGTFTARTPWYQTWFVKRCYDALNNQDSSSLYEAMRYNEQANHRCIGLTVETRPDWFRLQQVDQTLSYGATRVELGVQTTYDNILFGIKRGHTVSDTIAATRIAKDVGLKVCYHMMPGLPGSNESLDKQAFQTIFSQSDYKPDMLKIYPCLVIEGTALYDLWKAQEFSPLSSDEASRQIAEILSGIPEWVRVQRIQRDVPAQYIDSGVTKSNLRQMVDEVLDKRGLSSLDLRNRELGHVSLKNQEPIDLSEVVMKQIQYTASGGTEVFLSLMTKPSKAVIGYLRLRMIENAHRQELNKGSVAMIREVKVVGQELEIGQKSEGSIQHRGFGTQLIHEAERISEEEFDQKQLFVLSGVGVKEYYRKYHQFLDNGVYLWKKIGK